MAKEVRHRVTENVHIKVERWRKGARKPETDEIIVKRIRSVNGPTATTIEELTRQVFGSLTDQPKAIPPRRTDGKKGE